MTFPNLGDFALGRKSLYILMIYALGGMSFARIRRIDAEVQLAVDPQRVDRLLTVSV